MTHENSLLPDPVFVNPAWAKLCGAGWRAPAWRAALLFVLAELLWAYFPVQGLTFLAFLCMLSSFTLLSIAIYRFRLEAEASAEEATGGVQLGDGMAQPVPFDAVVSLSLQEVEKPKAWSIELLHALEWKRMADLCLALYKERDLLSRNVKTGGDGSVEACLYQAGQEENFALLYCKARGEQELGVGAVQAVLARMRELGLTRAFFMGAWSFSDEARHLAREHRITLVDDRMLLVLLSRLPHDDSQRLLNIAVEGDYTTPTCPACQLKMIPRENAQGRYWGCRAYPHCKHTLGMHA